MRSLSCLGVLLHPVPQPLLCWLAFVNFIVICAEFRVIVYSVESNWTDLTNLAGCHS